MRLRVASLFVIVIVIVAGILSGSMPQLQFIQDFGSWALTPAQEAVNGPANAVSEMGENLRSPAELHDEVQALRAQVARLEQENARLAELEREVKEMRDNIGLKEAYPEWQLLEAAIVARDPVNIIRAVTVNRGSADGVKEGMTVVTPAGLVGLVIKVTPVASKVLLITDSSSTVTSLVQSSRAQGVISGERAEHLRMKYIAQSAVVRSGDKVITSGIGGIYPPDILIGVVSSVSKKDTDMFQEARVEPAVAIDSLETVLIITNHVPINLDVN